MTPSTPAEPNLKALHFADPLKILKEKIEDLEMRMVVAVYEMRLARARQEKEASKENLQNAQSMFDAVESLTELYNAQVALYEELGGTYPLTNNK